MSKTKKEIDKNQVSLNSFFINNLNPTETQKNDSNKSFLNGSLSTMSKSNYTIKNENVSRLSLNSETNISKNEKNYYRNVRSDINSTFEGKFYYPDNKELYRSYQFDIIKTCMKENTLVCIPTGLGKTFIASVLMYNYHLWFKGKIFFLAPTRPLVNQQINAFNNLFKGLNVCEITGKQSTKIRQILYSDHKIFFMTPQTLDNDLKNNIVSNPNDISLVIFDEAHKATKNYSYVNVVNRLVMSIDKETNTNDYIFNQNLNNDISKNLSSNFRIVGLSASPGTTIDAIQNVIDSLRISAVELRTENDEEIIKYSHTKKIQIAEIVEEASQTNVLKLIDKMILMRAEVMKKYRVFDKKVTINYLTIFFVIKSQENFKKSRFAFEEEFGKSMVSEIYENFSIIFSLLGAKKALITQGIEALKRCINTIENKNESKKTKCKLNGITWSKNKDQSKSKFNDIVNDNKIEFKTDSKNFNSTIKKTTFSKARENLILSEDFKKLKYEVFERNVSSSNKKVGLDIHPKLNKLHEIISSNENALNNFSKAIIFTQFKDSAREINEYLTKRFDLKFHVFHGQDKKFKQKDQLEIMKKFRDGEIRVLICTSIAEEGLDIGEVDIIICYDMLSSSPIRMIQRFGRTGRKRDGVIIVLASKGDEKNKYFQCLNKLRHLNEELKNLGVNFKKTKIKLANADLNISINNSDISKVEYFCVKSEVIDNADDFYYDSSELDESIDSNNIEDIDCNDNEINCMTSEKINENKFHTVIKRNNKTCNNYYDLNCSNNNQDIFKDVSFDIDLNSDNEYEIKNDISNKIRSKSKNQSMTLAKNKSKTKNEDKTHNKRATNNKSKSKSKFLNSIDKNTGYKSNQPIEIVLEEFSELFEVDENHNDTYKDIQAAKNNVDNMFTENKNIREMDNKNDVEITKINNEIINNNSFENIVTDKTNVSDVLNNLKPVKKVLTFTLAKKNADLNNKTNVDTFKTMNTISENVVSNIENKIGKTIENNNLIINSLQLEKENNSNNFDKNYTNNNVVLLEEKEIMIKDNAEINYLKLNSKQNDENIKEHKFLSYEKNYKFDKMKSNYNVTKDKINKENRKNCKKDQNISIENQLVIDKKITNFFTPSHQRCNHQFELSKKGTESLINIYNETIEKSSKSVKSKQPIYSTDDNVDLILTLKKEKVSLNSEFIDQIFNSSVCRNKKKSSELENDSECLLSLNCSKESSKRRMLNEKRKLKLN